MDATAIMAPLPAPRSRLSSLLFSGRGASVGRLMGPVERLPVVHVHVPEVDITFRKGGQSANGNPAA